MAFDAGLDFGADDGGEEGRLWFLDPEDGDEVRVHEFGHVSGAGDVVVGPGEDGGVFLRWRLGFGGCFFFG